MIQKRREKNIFSFGNINDFWFKNRNAVNGEENMWTSSDCSWKWNHKFVKWKKNMKWNLEYQFSPSTLDLSIELKSHVKRCHRRFSSLTIFFSFLHFLLFFFGCENSFIFLISYARWKCVFHFVFILFVGDSKLLNREKSYHNKFYFISISSISVSTLLRLINNRCVNALNYVKIVTLILILLSVFHFFFRIIENNSNSINFKNKIFIVISNEFLFGFGHSNENITQKKKWQMLNIIIIIITSKTVQHPRNVYASAYRTCIHRKFITYNLILWIGHHIKWTIV